MPNYPSNTELYNQAMSQDETTATLWSRMPGTTFGSALKHGVIDQVNPYVNTANLMAASLILARPSAYMHSLAFGYSMQHGLNIPGIGRGAPYGFRSIIGGAKGAWRGAGLGAGIGLLSSIGQDDVSAESVIGATAVGAVAGGLLLQPRATGFSGGLAGIADLFKRKDIADKIRNMAQGKSGYVLGGPGNMGISRRSMNMGTPNSGAGGSTVSLAAPYSASAAKHINDILSQHTVSFKSLYAGTGAARSWGGHLNLGRTVESAISRQHTPIVGMRDSMEVWGGDGVTGTTIGEAMYDRARSYFSDKLQGSHRALTRQHFADTGNRTDYLSAFKEEFGLDAERVFKGMGKQGLERYGGVPQKAIREKLERQRTVMARQARVHKRILELDAMGASAVDLGVDPTIMRHRARYQKIFDTYRTELDTNTKTIKKMFTAMKKMPKLTVLDIEGSEKWANPLRAAVLGGHELVSAVTQAYIRPSLFGFMDAFSEGNLNKLRANYYEARTQAARGIESAVQKAATKGLKSKYLIDRAAKGTSIMESAALRTFGSLALWGWIGLGVAATGAIVKGTARAAVNSMRTIATSLESISRTEFGTGRAFESMDATNERMRAIQAINNSGINARMYLGREAQIQSQ